MFIGCLIVFVVSFVWFGFLGAMSGNSLPPPFQITQKWAGQIPEIIFALSVAGMWLWFRNDGHALPLWVNIHDFARDALIVYAGKQAATWAMLSDVFKNGYQRDDNGDGVVDYDDGRKSKIKNIADDLAESVNVPITSPRYALVWSFLKGALMTLPIGLGVVGGVLHAIGHYLGFKLFDKFDYSNAYKEWIGSGLCLGGLAVMLYLIKIVF
jgi:hypothetical protein